VDEEEFRATMLARQAEVEEAESPLAGSKKQPGQITSELDGGAVPKLNTRVRFPSSAPLFYQLDVLNSPASR
jgi:hypothetical protein